MFGKLDKAIAKAIAKVFLTLVMIMPTYAALVVAGVSVFIAAGVALVSLMVASACLPLINSIKD